MNGYNSGRSSRIVVAPALKKFYWPQTSKFSKNVDFYYKSMKQDSSWITECSGVLGFNVVGGGNLCTCYDVRSDHLWVIQRDVTFSDGCFNRLGRDRK